MIAPPDERRGVPSASGMIRVVNCPASFKAEREAEKIAPESRDDKDAAAGNVVHAILSGDETEDDVTYSAEATAEMCEHQVTGLLEEWLDRDGADPLHYSEVRYGLTTFGTVLEVTPESRASFIFTGQFDRLYIQGNRGLLIDFKALHGDHAAAIENPQLASLAVLVSIKHKLTSIRAAIVQPWKGRPTVADYDAEALSKAHDWLCNALLLEAQSTPDDRRAGKWCHHCKARFCCDVFKAPVLQEVERIQPMSIAGLPGKEQAAAMFTRAMEFTPEQHAAAYRGLSIIARYRHAIESSFKVRVEAGEIPRFGIKTKPGNREVTDAQKAFTGLAPLGVTEGDMLEAATVSITALEEALRKRSGIKSKTDKRTTYNMTTQQAKDALNRALEEVGALGRKADKQEIVEVGQLEGGEV